MRKLIRYSVITGLLATLLACAKATPPADNFARTPDEVLLETYLLMVRGQCTEAMTNFSAAYVETFITEKGKTAEDYCASVAEWQEEWLRVEVKGNDYNDAMWRVKVIPDEGKGSGNRPGAVHDFYLIDGAWKIVFWGDYPKS